MDRYQIEEKIINYINDDSARYGVMITGTWGCGKTYLYEHYLKQSIEKMEFGKNEKDRKSCIYISLYGIGSIDALSKEMLTKFWYEVKLRDNEIAQKVSKYGSGIINIISRVVNISLPMVSISFDQVFSDAKSLIDTKNLVICFDDLERCDIPITELFGYINNLIEHCNCKVLILADEDNIGRMYANKNIEAKYISILNGGFRLKYEESKNIHKQTNQNSQEGTYISIDELKEYCKTLYSDTYIYKDIKEKVIGHTYAYIPRIDDIYNDLISKDKGTIYQHGKIRDYLEEDKEQIINCFKRECGCRNIRIICSWMRSVDDLFRKIISVYNGDRLTEVLRYFSRYSIWFVCAKSFNKKLSAPWSTEQTGWKALRTIDYVQWENEGQIIGFKLVDDYYNEGIEPNEHSINFAIDFIMTEIAKIEDFDRRNKSSNGYKYSELKTGFLYMDDEKFASALNEMLVELHDGKYVFQDYQSIIMLLARFLIHELIDESYIYSVLDIMRENINEKDGFAGVCDVIYDTYTVEEKEVFNKYYAEIRDLLIARSKQDIVDETVNDEIYKSGKAFTQFCYSNEIKFWSQKSFMRFVNKDMFYKLIESSSKEDLYYIIKGLNNVYRIEALKDTFPHDDAPLKEVKNMLENTSIKAFEGKIGKIVQQEFNDTLNGILSKYEE